MCAQDEDRFVLKMFSLPRRGGRVGSLNLNYIDNICFTFNIEHIMGSVRRKLMSSELGVFMIKQRDEFKK